MAVLLARRGDLADRLQARKAVGFGQPGDVVDDRGAAGLDAAVVAVGGGGEVVRRCLRIVEEQAHVLEQRRLVGLERQRSSHRRARGSPAPWPSGVHGVGGDDAAVQRQQGQQLGHGRDLVRLARRPAAGPAPGAARHAQALTRCKGALALLAVERAARGLAVDRDHALDQFRQGRQKRAKQASKATGSSSRNSREKVSWLGMPPGSVRKRRRQRLLGAPEQGHVDAGLGAAQGREQRDHA